MSAPRESGQSLRLYEESRRLYEQARQLNPEDVRNQSGLGKAWDGMGLTLARMGRPEEALSAFHKAIALQRAALARAPEQIERREDLDSHYHHLGALQHELGRPAETADTSLERQRLQPTNPNVLFAVACDLARCIPLVGKNSPFLSAQQRLERDKYAGLTLEALRQSIAHGYEEMAELENHPALDALRARPDFQKLLAEVPAKRKTERE